MEDVDIKEENGKYTTTLRFERCFLIFDEKEMF